MVSQRGRIPGAEQGGGGGAERQGVRGGFPEDVQPEPSAEGRVCLCQWLGGLGGRGGMKGVVGPTSRCFWGGPQVMQAQWEEKAV